MGGSNTINSVFYADAYHPIQAGSIDGTDTAPHDNGVYRALLCSSAGLYDPSGDPNLIGDPYCTLFVAHLSHLTTEHTLRKAMSKYGNVKNLRLVRHIVTGASRGYAFVEFETEREMRRAYKDAHHSLVDDYEIIVDYSRQQLMPGWIPRRLGGGLGGRKESGQLRFGGRERPFRAPLQPIPYDELKKLGIPPPPEGRYMWRFQVPSPPRRTQSSIEREESSHRRSSKEEHRYRSSSAEREDYYKYNQQRSMEKEEHFCKTYSGEREEHDSRGSSMDPSHKMISLEKDSQHYRRSSLDSRKHKEERSSLERDYRLRRTSNKDDYSRQRSSRDRREGSHKHHTHVTLSNKHKRRRSSSSDYSSGH